MGDPHRSGGAAAFAFERESLEHLAAALERLEAGFDSLLDYYYFLRYDPGGADELAALTEALVVGETYLFREFAPLQVLVDRFVTRWCAQGRRVRIWSAACVVDV